MSEEIKESPKPWHKKAHKHAELIKQWADGAQIQFLACDSWVDCDPAWDSFASYRVKPERTFIRYRVALMKYTPVNIAQDKLEDIFFTLSTDSNRFLEKSSEFVRWITDWIEVEVEDH